MTLTDRVLRVLEDGPGTTREIAAEFDEVPWRTIGGTLSNLRKVGKVIVLKTLPSEGKGAPQNMWSLP